MMNGWAHEGDGGAFTFAGQLKGQDKAVATLFYLQNIDPFGHFAYLVRAIDSMMQTGHAPYPVERTLLTTGILDAAMHSRADRAAVATPELNFAYQARDFRAIREMGASWKALEGRQEPKGVGLLGAK